jgi:hypothetical protein
MASSEQAMLIKPVPPINKAFIDDSPYDISTK